MRQTDFRDIKKPEASHAGVDSSIG